MEIKDMATYGLLAYLGGGMALAAAKDGINMIKKTLEDRCIWRQVPCKTCKDCEGYSTRCKVYLSYRELNEREKAYEAELRMNDEKRK